MAYGNGNRVFGQAMKKKGNPSTRYQRQFGGGGRRDRAKQDSNENPEQSARDEAAARRMLRQKQGEAIDIKFGYKRLEDQPFDPNQPIEEHRGWLFHMLATTRVDQSSGAEQSGVDLFFVGHNNKTFKTTLLHRPYFYVVTHKEDEQLGHHLIKKFPNSLVDVQHVPMVDLEVPNHLSPNNLTRNVWKLHFDNVSQLMDVRKQLQDIVKSNGNKSGQNAMEDFFSSQPENGAITDVWSNIQELREYDVPYVSRVCMDLDIRAGTWYTVTLEHQDGGPPLPHLSDPDIETKANPRVLAFDIECTKAPLKFPNAEIDEIYMISYMISDMKGDARGALVSSRKIVSQDIPDFEYTPKPSYPGPFHIFNESNEEKSIRRFIQEFHTYRPQVVVTYNGDSFDWPFLITRAKVYGIDLWKELGISQVGDEEVLGRCCVHLDCFAWVQRDSYLPQGAQGLKAVTKYKLGYDPVDVDPEDMLPMAQERPVHMATYSVSDAVATYYLYEKYVHLFIFSLCTLIPMGPEDVLRKGSGTLCEALLMVQANYLDILCPNKQVDPLASFHKGHLLESETYIGGKVECLETGVYRSDVEYDFDLKPSAFQHLIDNIDRDLSFAFEVESGIDRSDITNYEEVRSTIVEQLEMLRDRPKRREKPFIYHLDVGAMYPNIILTNRLQPGAIVNDAVCATCDFNQAKNGCKRRMEWVWRGDYNPAGKLEYERTKDQLSRETHKDGQHFNEMTDKEQAGLVATRLKDYSRNAYRKTKMTEEVTRTDIVCMRENDFYVETVRRFRDRRYDYKKMTKAWKKKIGSAPDAASRKEAEDKALVYDSLQVAHKCILNSFYGYVMRKGARWRSMPMAGIVTKTGADLIVQARALVEQIGRPLELDTDGIWCILPKSFPDVYTFKTHDGSKVKIEYPCLMLNADVHDNFTNHQYQTLKDKNTGSYESRSECSIFFEVDGPYRCMVLPASTEEGKLLKKRYAVFNFDGSLAELKGFELKRRGELELIKTFQSQVFERFLDGDSLSACYDSVAEVANHWIDVIDSRGESLDDEELFDLISENRNMSRQLEEYGDQKGTSQTTARRLGEFLGAEIIKDKGLNCKFIIAEQPYGAPVTERAIPTAIWKAEPSLTKHFLRKWLRAPGLDGDGLDIRNILDWDYYLERLGKTIQKIITIPAALQKMPNPVPRISHPAWLDSKVQQMNDKFQQRSIKDMFKSIPNKNQSEPESEPVPMDIEDFAGTPNIGPQRPVVHTIRGTLEEQRQHVDVVVQPELEQRIVLTKGDFSSWLQQKKNTWRKTRRERRALEGGRSTRDSSTSLPSNRAAGSMEGFLKEAAQSLVHSEWQIIELREMSQDSETAKKSSGEFIAWVMVGKDSLRRVQVSVPRIVYVASPCALKCTAPSIYEFKQVDMHLPHNTNTKFLYEVSMPEFVYRKGDWASCLQPLAGQSEKQLKLEIFETGTPLKTRALTALGGVSKLSNLASKKQRSYLLFDLEKVDRPTQGIYLNEDLSYRVGFLYVKINAKTRSGIVAFFGMHQGSGGMRKNQDESSYVNLACPSKSEVGSFDISTSCQIWVVKPGSRRGQKNISARQCEDIFHQLLETIAETADLESEYACVRPDSSCQFAGLSFVDREEQAYTAVNDTMGSFVKSTNCPTFVLLNSNRPATKVRRSIATLSSLPVISLPFPPGPEHNPSSSSLPALNWEQPAVQLCHEAYLYASVVSYPKRVACARYGNLPIGNLGTEEDLTLYDIGMARMLQRNRALSWASPVSGIPDLGASLLSSGGGAALSPSDALNRGSNGSEAWGDDMEVVSPVVRRPGCYRTVCVDIDLHDLAIAALTDVASVSTNPTSRSDSATPVSPTSVLQVGSDGDFGSMKLSEPLGDEMSTSTSLAILRTLVCTWLKDAFSTNNEIADSMLHHVYRLISNPSTLMHDPALHRVVVSLMKATFQKLLQQLQRLGCSIVHASFHRITVATNKTTLGDAEEYVNFIISTLQNTSSEGDDVSVLSRLALRPRQYHTQFLFLDEYNYGTMHLERMERSEVDTDDIVEEGDGSSVVVPSVVTAWSIMHYLGSETAKQYFRVIIARFSKEVLRKQLDLQRKSDVSQGVNVIANRPLQEALVAYKRKMVSKHFASSLTRAVAEIIKDSADNSMQQEYNDANPVLEFIKSVMTVLEIDEDVQAEVHGLRRSLLAQVGVAEYSSLAKWKNPCPTFILPDVFCWECREARDINLCYTPTTFDNEEPRVMGVLHQAVQGVFDVVVYNVVVSRDRDLRQYRIIQLSNNLKVLLVSTADELKESGTSTVEAAAVHIEAGQFDDTIPGISHFHEHMLFLGTAKYPEEDEYERYLSRFGGSCNAYTGMEDTNYYFGIRTSHNDTTTTSEGLKGALDRFSQFFINPLFNGDMVEREIQAIDSEYQGGRADDAWRLFQIQKATANPLHPFSKFGCGNKQTLTSNGGPPVEELKKFFEKFYKTSNMRLVVAGASSLDALQETVEKTFGCLKHSDDPPRYVKVNPHSPLFPREHAVHGHDTPAFGPSNLGLYREVVPLVEAQAMSIQFAMPPTDDPILKKTKPHRAFSHLLGHESPGSLHQFLDDAGYITSLSSGVSMDTADFALFEVAIGLTPRGVDKKEEVLDLFFQWLQLIKTTALEKPDLIAKYHNELRQIAMTHFKFRESGDLIDFCSSAAQCLFEDDIAGSDLLRRNAFYEEYDPQIGQALLERLHPQNCIVTIANSKFDIAEGDWEVEPWYGGMYRQKKLSFDNLKRWESEDIHPRLQIPDLNQYIPTNFALRSSNTVESPSQEVERSISIPPALVSSGTKNVRLYHKMDKSWGVPKTFIRFSLVSPTPYESARSMTLCRLFQRVLTDDLNCQVYDASVAGCKYRIQTLIDEMREGGERQPELLKKFRKARMDLLRETRNYRLDDPIEVVNYNSRLLIEDNVWDLDNYIGVLQDEDLGGNLLTMEQCADVIEESCILRSRVTALSMGNIDEDEAAAVEKLISERFQKNSTILQDAELPKFRSMVLPTCEEAVAIFGPAVEGTSIPVKYQELSPSASEENNAVEVVMQVGSEWSLGHEGCALLLLLSQLASTSAYSQLRTKEQLGYSVGASARKMAGGLWAFSVFVQSGNHDPVFLESRIEAWLTTFRDEIDAMDPEDLTMEALGVVTQLLEAPSSLSQEVEAMWREILQVDDSSDRFATPMFNRLELVAAELLTDGCNTVVQLDEASRKSPEKLKQKILLLIDKFLHPQSPTRRIMSSRYYNQGSEAEFKATLHSPGILSKYSEIHDLKSFLSTWPVAPLGRTMHTKTKDDH
eukprot:Nitzschia sp. Nitz4//scaffold180_size44305//24137//35517//NITZ4_007241-RA/size44305-processed-gene-0.44-mRNA-1//1//CDS//3329539473//3400//frame0